MSREGDRGQTASDAGRGLEALPPTANLKKPLAEAMLAREGLAPNHKKLPRIYREEGLKVRRRGGRKRSLGTRAPMTLP